MTTQIEKHEKSMSTVHSVFVYGTLKKGEPNHHWLAPGENGQAKFISKGKTVKEYPLVIASKYNIPFLLHSPGKGKNVIGEVYEVDEKMLANLDDLEDHPTFYIREIEEVELLSDNVEKVFVKCWIYFLKKFKPHLLDQEFFVEYSSSGSHSKPYVTAKDRIPGYHARTDVLLVMGILSLQEACFIKLAVMFCTSKDMEKQMLKQKNGVVQAEEGLRDIKNSVLSLPLVVIVKNRLLHFIERVGYEILVFMTRSHLNYPELQFSLADIEWYPDGLINEKSTYVHYFEKKPNIFLNFECFSLICEEKKLREIWPKVSSNTQRLKMNNLLVPYWVHNLQNNLNSFVDHYGHFIVGFEPGKSLYYNMVLYCLNLSFKTSLKYFFTRLSFLERQLLADEDLPLTHLSLFKKIVRNPKQEHFKFICGFLEKPITDKSFFESISKHMPAEGIVELINYLLRQVNFFGNLHYSLLKRIFAMLNDEERSIVLSKLDFYVLSLLAKGHLETFEFSFKNSKEVLLQQISTRLKGGQGLGLIYTIKKNNQRHLLEKLILYLSEGDKELLFYLNTVLNES